MVFTTCSVSVFTAGFKTERKHRVVAVGSLMHPYGLLSDFKNSNTAYIGRGAREVLVNH